GRVGADVNFQVHTERGGGVIYAMKNLPDGRVLAAGDFVRVNGHATSGVARFHADGTIDRTFRAPRFNRAVRALHVRADGSILAGGVFSQVGEHPRNGFARLFADGAIDAGYRLIPAGSVPPPAYVFSLAEQSDGKIVLFGGQTSVRLNTDGT